ncbi:hypothetical protein PsYK624_165940 [Phanerochaete sordida]|uniref:F-box domain-containing protein n=1 Tax=Phanerochaete sordida TaxID=48140 RepID=A0A9P3GR45_9APHY|nr:hypothetical protein PsYK624_165940 [Phanerochaete sordida]
MPPVTGADLPSEVIANILSNFAILAWDNVNKYRSWKQGLVASSLVCRYWSECIRPALFEDITSRDASDLSFIEGIVYSPQFNNSSLNGAIKYLRAKHYFPPLPQPWLHHLHSLMAHLPQTEFWCYVKRETRASQLSVPVRWPPFAALPRVPPSFYSLRLSVIRIIGSELKSTTELARLVDSFPAVQECYFSQLKFIDPSPIIRARRIPRKVPRALGICVISECADVPISAQARLALDLLAAAPRQGLAAEDPQWSALLDTLLALVPSGFRGARMDLYQSGGAPLDGRAPGRVVLGFSETDTPDDDQLTANVWVERARATLTRAGDAPAYVSKISLTASFASAEDGHPPSFDGFQEAVDLARFEELWFYVRAGNAQDEAGMQTLVRSLLRREQLTWALDRGVLWLSLCAIINGKVREWGDIAYIDRRTLLSAPAGRSVPIIDATPPTLDNNEHAEHLSLFFEDKRADYLRRLPALRIERAKAKARLLEETSELPANQVTAVPAPHTTAGEGAGGNETEERDADALCGDKDEDGGR